MVDGIIELINFAHGEIYTIGAFTALIVASALGIMGFPAAGIIVIAALAAVIWCAAYGYTIEKIAYRPLRGAPRLSPLISAIGVSIFLQNYVSLAQTSDFVAFPQLIKMCIRDSGTSAPMRAASPTSSGKGRGSGARAFSHPSSAAASALPPPSPAPCGMPFSSTASTPGRKPEASANRR